MRLERAFLLEQLAKRTSTNVEDSDGSPSPPPTVRTTSPDPSYLPTGPRHKASRGIANHSSPQPKEKPLRIKRGHRKPASDAAKGGGGAGFSNLSVVDAASPNSEAGLADGQDEETIAADFHASKTPTAFELYCEDTRAALLEKSKDDGDASFDLDEELAKTWTSLPSDEKEDFEARAAALERKQSKGKEVLSSKSKGLSALDAKVEANAATGDETPQATQDEDVEMANDDSDQETQGERLDE